jgi:hypothetical protein
MTPIFPTHKFEEIENTDPIPYGCTYMVKKHKLVPIQMTPKEITLIERFINGEKDLYKQILLINPDDSVHGKYLKAFISDDMPATLAAKKEVIAVMPKPDKKMKPSFTPRKSKE